MTEINGWISNLTKYTASARMNFNAELSDEELTNATFNCLMAELHRKGRSDEAQWDLWELKDGINRDYAIFGKASARIRLRRKNTSKQNGK